MTGFDARACESFTAAHNGSDAATTSFVSSYDAPASGDVIIASNGGLYSIGTVSDRQQLSLARSEPRLLD